MSKHKMAVETKVVRAIDVGFGNTKFTMSRIDDFSDVKAESVKTGIFPSVVVKNNNKQNFGVGSEVASEIYPIVIDSNEYLAGPDVLDHTQGLQARNLSNDYCTTNDYLALLRAALYRIAQPTIDLLVLGLPLNTFEEHKDELQLKMKGPHTLPHPNKLSASQGLIYSTEVKRVVVVPQPVGAFFNYAIPRNIYEDMKEETNLILDPGFGTFDWYLASGIKAQNSRCGAYKGGVSGVLMAVADAIDPSVRQSPKLMQRLDTALVRALVTDSPVTIKISGKEIDIQKYKSLAMEQARTQINAMMNGISTLLDVDNIILTGGGHGHFLPALKETLDRDILVDDNPVLSNCLGFQMLGQSMVESMGD